MEADLQGTLGIVHIILMEVMVVIIPFGMEVVAVEVASESAA